MLLKHISKEREELFRRLSIVTILVFSFVFILLSTMTPTHIIGESDDYMAAELALENHLSLKITESDVEEARVDFPEHYEYIENSWQDGNFLTDKNGNRYPWYLGTYSLSCIPMKFLLDFLGLNQSYAFALTNVLFYIGALVFTFKKLKTSDLNRFLTIILLACSPTVLYYFWPSAEMFMFSLVAIALVCFVNGSYKLSALLISAVGTLNPTIMFFGVAIILDYFVILYKQSNSKNMTNFFKMCLSKFQDILVFGACFLPSFIPFIFNYVHFGSFNMQDAAGMARTQDWGDRFLSYLFDLNLGFLPFYFIAFILFLIIIAYGIIIKNRRSIIFALGFFGTVGSYSIMWHINCGMTGISRYNAWAAPIFIFYLTTQTGDFFKSIVVKKAMAVLLAVSAVYTSLVVYEVKASEYGMDYTYMSPIAVKVLDNFPSLYNPYHYTFISRSIHEDGGYRGDWGNESIARKPVIYSNNDGYIRKILLMKPINVEELKNNIVGNKKDLDALYQELEKIDKTRPYQYLNFGKGTTLVDISNLKNEFDPIKYKDLQQTSKGIYANEGDFHWCSSDAIIRLRADENKHTGLLIKYEVIQALFDLNKNSECKFDILINGKYIKTEYLTKAGQFNVYIDSSKLPVDDTKIFDIELRTNVDFSPIQYGNLNDPRELSIILKYIGQV